MSEVRRGDGAGKPQPGFAAALALTALAWFGSVAVAALCLRWTSLPTALAVGVAAAFGGAGTLAARRLPPPLDKRLGLQGFAPRFLGVIALLTPAVVLSSELDNLVAALLSRPAPGAPEPGRAPDGASAWLIVEGVIAMVLLRPVVEEFFFRGVVLHDLAVRFGTSAAVALTALLDASCQVGFALPAGAAAATSVGIQTLFVGLLLGLVRCASGSLLAAILLQALLRGSGALAVGLAEQVAIPGFNAPGAHTPSGVLVAAALSTGLGVRLARSYASRAEPAAARPPEA